jgi:hypothetical protein
MKTNGNIHMRVARAALEGIVVLAFMALVIVFSIAVVG